MQYLNSTSNTLVDRYFAKRTRHHVDFFCHAPNARRVSLIADFNGWNPESNPMLRTLDGYWRISLELPHGHHQYLYLVDGKPVLDPDAAGKTCNDRNRSEEHTSELQSL
jgi:1,4-alpha-glucan branching enzyme